MERSGEGDVVLTGIGGQGIQLAAKSLATALTNAGKSVMLAAHWGGEMRGGQTEATVVYADRELRSLPILPVVGAAIVMHAKFLGALCDRLRRGAFVVSNADLVDGAVFDAGDALTVYPVPGQRLATEAEAPMGACFALLGAYAALSELADHDALAEAMTSLLPAYRAEHVAANRRALAAGERFAREQHGVAGCRP